MEKNAKLAPLQASLRQVAIFLHNADFYRLRRSKMPANALRQIYFPALFTENNCSITSGLWNIKFLKYYSNLIK